MDCAWIDGCIKHKQTFHVGDEYDLGFSTSSNDVEARARGNSDSEDYKEFELHITQPPRSCTRQEQSCSADCTRTWCVGCFTTVPHRAQDLLQRIVGPVL